MAFCDYSSYAQMMPRELADVLREAIAKSGKSAMQLSAETGVSQPTITEFLRGKDIRLKTAEKLAAYLGLELTKRGQKRSKKP